jgi:oligoendopeptidase F
MTKQIGKNLTYEFKRDFVESEVDFAEPDSIEKLYDKLAQMPLEDSSQIEDLLLKWSEVESILSEEEAVRYILMTCQTDDPEREKAFLHYVENITPRLKPKQFEMAQKLLGSFGIDGLSKDRYGVLVRDLKSEVEIFREENIPLQTKEEKLSQKYQKICGSLTVNHDGEEKTLQQMAKYLELTDRNGRQEAWEKVVKRRLFEQKTLDDLFDEMLEVRGKIASNSGFDNFRDYAFKMRKRFDYGVLECETFHKAVEEAVVPLYREIQENRRKQMGLDNLRPWDLAPDPLGRPPLKPFENVSELIAGCQKIYDRLDPVLGERFKFMAEHELLELESRKGKAPGAYSHGLQEVRLPFIFQSAVGIDGDVNTLLHETGHSFHTLEARQEPLVFYRHAPIEFAEVASMSMEFLGGDHLDVFYNEEDAARSQIRHLESVVWIFCWVATVDAFQHWIYTHPGHSQDERAGAWLDLKKRFGGIEDWSGFEDSKKYEWHRQLHIFEIPFYYIEYAIAELGALQIWVRAKDDPEEALSDYRKALSLGGAKTLPELFEAAGIRFDMSVDTISPLIKKVKDVLDKH